MFLSLVPYRDGGAAKVMQGLGEIFSKALWLISSLTIRGPRMGGTKKKVAKKFGALSAREVPLYD